MASIASPDSCAALLAACFTESSPWADLKPPPAPQQEASQRDFECSISSAPAPRITFLGGS
jgi:uncharacterized lipoprotein YajG